MQSFSARQIEICDESVHNYSLALYFGRDDAQITGTGPDR